MAISNLSEDLNIIQALDDQPNDVGGLTAAELKAKFDYAGNAIKDYLNDTIVPAINDMPTNDEINPDGKEGQYALASETVAKSGDTMTGNLTVGDGSQLAPWLRVRGSGASVYLHVAQSNNAGVYYNPTGDPGEGQWIVYHGIEDDVNVLNGYAKKNNPARVCSGTSGTVSVAAGAQESVTITFGTEMSATPYVVCSDASTDPSLHRPHLAYTVTSQSKTGFDVTITNGYTDALNARFNWIAVAN